MGIKSEYGSLIGSKALPHPLFNSTGSENDISFTAVLKAKRRGTCDSLVFQLK